jgi:DNA-binding winged helix-turn-helix (wHTH) protein/tetratricopeptide (TPR) repeat protein
MSLEKQSPAILRFGVFEVDLRSGELRKQGARIKLQEQPFHVLTVLLQRPGEVVTREELRNQNWPADTFVDFDNSLNTAINKLREALGDSADSPRFIETLPRRGYRFISPVSSDNRIGRGTPETAPRPSWKILFAVVAVFAIGAAGMAGLYLRWKKPRLTEKDTVVLADFLNTTGDSAFDDALKQGLRAQLEQSPFLNLLSDQQVGEELRLMARQPGEHLTPDIARDLCRRIGSKAVLNGSISSLGSHYVIGLSATDCQTGTPFGTEQSESADKEHVLAALGASATGIRKKLGETLPSIQKYNVPIEQVTTGSLEALQAYSLGMKYVTLDDYRGALPHFQRAVELDPNFASAHMRVANAIWEGGGQGSIADENIEKAYALRNRVSRREYFHITTRYFGYLEDLEKGDSEAELWAEIYPRDAEAHYILADKAMWKGNWEEAVKHGRVSVDANPNDNRNYYNLAVSELALDRLDAAKRTCDQAIARNKNDAPIHLIRYWIAFVRHDPKEMESEVKVLGDLARENPETEKRLLLAEMATEMYYGKLARARGFFQRFADIQPGIYAFWAILNAELGNKSEARAYAQRASKGHKPDDLNFVDALVAARVGETSLAEKWAASYDRKSPSGWVLQKRYLPVMRAAVAMARGNAAEAIEHLRVVNSNTPYFANDPSSADGMQPAYLRGQAYLQLRQGKEAASEFQRLIDHPGIVVNALFGPLARVGLARAYVLQGDTAKARAAYQDFFTLWKDADPDIPILKQAKAEYAKLQ